MNNDLYYEVIYHLISIIKNDGELSLALLFFPYVILMEMPFNIIIILASIRNWLRRGNTTPYGLNSYPLITVIITSYNESKEELNITMRSLAEQNYPGKIESIFIFDGANNNKLSIRFAEELMLAYKGIRNREFRIVKKFTRGGHANSMNLGLRLAKGNIFVMLDADTSIDNQSISWAVRHFNDPNVICVSGAVRVRNFKDTILTRLQAIEYMLGIQLGRFGLSEVNAVNNISGAFGIFKTDFIRRIGGWLNGTAEDLDLTLRMHAYSSRYPNLKIVHEPYAVAWTAAPKKVRKLLKQRMRWDGDLYYIFVRRHWRKFSGRFLGRTKNIFMIWYSLYFQLTLPFIILFYTIWLFLHYDLGFLIAINSLIYAYYLTVEIFLFLLFLILVSERPRQDAKLFGWLFLMPIYLQIMRLVAGYFIIREMIFKTHKTSSMAPWYIIRKTK
ncbi:glycosyltransferase family 2 protein [Legionella sp. D16C41]|uniref:glycosyltransferase family 2 protein n=1 Tax=Legionella sp. D16C41 TaxID=3402688 RepID=UPI003AF8F473